jgi:hypothetical protein
MVSRRGTSNTNIRGNTAQRRARKAQLLARDGDGDTAPCWECGTRVAAAEMVADRIKAGRDGGSYQIDNLRVHCHPCSRRQGAAMAQESRRWRSLAERGLRRTHSGPDGMTTRAGWWILLDGEHIGFVRRVTPARRDSPWTVHRLKENGLYWLETARTQRQAIGSLANAHDSRPSLYLVRAS